VCAEKAVYADGASEEATWLALHSPGGAIQRAMSCDSVISEASIPDIDNVDDANFNKIGQLEFSLQYLRYDSSHFVHIILFYCPNLSLSGRPSGRPCVIIIIIIISLLASK